MKIGKYIKKQMKSKGIKQGVIADRLGLSDQTFSYRLRTGNITASQIFQISDMLGLDISDIKNEVEF